MKKIVLVLVLSALSLTAVFAAGFYVTPSAALSLSVGDYLRGGSLGGQALYDLGGIAFGLEAKADYDVAFNVVNFPLFVLIGLGRDFWVGAGYTIAAGSPQIISGTFSYPWSFGSFPNTYLLGVNLFRLPLPFGVLLAQSEISYTVNSPVNAADLSAVGTLISIFAGIKASVGVGLELGL